jgi:hypothetical protein
MRFQVEQALGARLHDVARQYETQGFFVLDGLEGSVTPLFRPFIADAVGMRPDALDEFLDAESEPVVLEPEVRQRLSRIDTAPSLARDVIRVLEPIFERLLGPVIHVSSNYHAQVKGGDQPAVDRGGGINEYREVQGQYLIHQDFTGARIPTSPCQLTLWVAQNTSPDWNLRLYPGSHRHGLLNNQWVSLDDPWLEQFGEPIDIPAREGTAVIFNSLVLHASSKPGPRRRVSCDIRFFPLCGFLPSTPHVLGHDPARRLREGEAEVVELRGGPTLRAPIRETLAYLGERVFDPSVPPLSILNWANYVDRYLNGWGDAAEHMARFVNVERGKDTPDIYTAKFHNQPIHTETIRTAAAGIATRSPRASFPALGELLEAWERPAPTITDQDANARTLTA